MKTRQRVASSNPTLDTIFCLSNEPPGDLSVARGECPEDSVVAGLV